jgi:uncharacterized membrane protein YfcA
MDLLSLIFTILIGAGSGVLGGALGINGSFLMLPSLMMLNIVSDYRMAVGTVLLSILPPLSLWAVVDYYKRGKVDISVGIILALSYFFAAKYGANINKEYSTKTLKYATTVVFLICALYFFWSAYNDKGSK